MTEPDFDHQDVARHIRTLAAQGRLHGPASELVKMFGLDYTEEAVA